MSDSLAAVAERALEDVLNRTSIASAAVTPPTLNGYLLGYPVVYVFDDPHRCADGSMSFAINAGAERRSTIM